MKKNIISHHLPFFVITSIFFIAQSINPADSTLATTTAEQENTPALSPSEQLYQAVLSRNLEGIKTILAENQDQAFSLLADNEHFQDGACKTPLLKLIVDYNDLPIFRTVSKTLNNQTLPLDLIKKIIESVHWSNECLKLVLLGCSSEQYPPLFAHAATCDNLEAAIMLHRGMLLTHKDEPLLAGYFVDLARQKLSWKQCIFNPAVQKKFSDILDTIDPDMIKELPTTELATTNLAQMNEGKTSGMIHDI